MYKLTFITNQKPKNVPSPTERSTHVHTNVKSSTVTHRPTILSSVVPQEKEYVVSTASNNATSVTGACNQWRPGSGKIMEIKCSRLHADVVIICNRTEAEIFCNRRHSCLSTVSRDTLQSLPVPTTTKTSLAVVPQSPIVVHTTLRSRTLGQMAIVKDCRPLGCGSCARAKCSVDDDWRLRDDGERCLRGLNGREGSIRVIEVSIKQCRNKRAGKREIPEKTRLPMASFGTIPTCENPVCPAGD
ncbi:hypothetical protein PR048_003066 [Dryococelus australis]|uniref:Uncharacterized protein n=1 Tax=Dryococelus australis TaxID=614101 RepID=A0ABQ9IM26_9NEOP|nr:hypothetical protein PR048_003066 [Dryococelus australis]